MTTKPKREPVKAKCANPVRFGVIGLGYMGLQHAQVIAADGEEFSLAAVADANPVAAARAGQQFAVPSFSDAQRLLNSGLVEAVLIAVPHYLHAPLTIRAARSGIHVLCEKPAAVEIGDARRMLEECRRNQVSLGCMLQMRRSPVMMRIRQMIQQGELGRIDQATFICSNWYRTQAYYDSGSWRGTWAGEGGGILTNQAPHHLDLLSWFLGHPRRVCAFLGTRIHQIEVENTANVLLEYEDGKAAYLYAATAENPRREQLVICGDKGVLQLERGRLRFGRLGQAVSDHIRSCPESEADRIPDPSCTWEDIVVELVPSDLRREVIRAFARHVRYGEAMVATGEDAAAEVELANAIYLSGYGREVVELPLGDVQASRMHQLLERLMQKQAKAPEPNLYEAAAAELARLEARESELARSAR